LDQQLSPVPVGVTGEIIIGGAGLARGYLNLPALTAEKFVPHPFSDEAGARLYRTGDLGRYLADGNIEFLGRLDSQVKIRGYRIEPGEIEEALKQHPEVTEASVVAHADALGNKRLLAYVVTAELKAFTTTALRDFLRERLPDYMIPSSFLTLESLPLSPNGKVDRRKLPLPDTARPSLEGAYVAPVSEAEQKLAEIWREVLGLERVGVQDNFFELGGDSILSLQVIAKANRAGFRLTPRQIFQHQTVFDLARVIDTTSTNEAEQGLIAGTLPLTPIQCWFFEQNIAEPDHWNQAVLLRLQRPLGLSILKEAVWRLLSQHDVLRLRFVNEGQNWRQFISPPDELVPVELVDLSSLSEDEQRATMTSVADKKQSSLNLSHGPLLRVVLFELGAQRPNRLLVIIHHLAIDTVSWRILLEDLETICSQLVAQEPVVLPAKTSSFKRWSEKLMEHVATPEVQREFAYWLSAASTETVSLPVDHDQRARCTTFSSARNFTVSLEPEETKALLQAVTKLHHTRINEVLLTALTQAFASWTGRRSLLVALEGHGREDLFADVDLSRTVGWFTSIFPVRLDLGDDDEPRAALKKVKDQLRRVPHHGIGYGLLRYLSDDEVAEKLRSLAWPEVSFNYHGQLDQAFSTSALFAPALESAGQPASLNAKRPFLLEINGSITTNRLQTVWTYSEEAHHAATVEKLANDFIAKLRELIARCQVSEAADYTPADFSAGKMSQHTLDKLLTRVTRAASLNRNDPS
jgi:non-ribosomal peptide synthase protein (TIGR01720 family)